MKKRKRCLWLTSWKFQIWNHSLKQSTTCALIPSKLLTFNLKLMDSTCLITFKFTSLTNLNLLVAITMKTMTTKSTAVQRMRMKMRTRKRKLRLKASMSLMKLRISFLLNLLIRRSNKSAYMRQMKGRKSLAILLLRSPKMSLRNTLLNLISRLPYKCFSLIFSKK